MGNVNKYLAGTCIMGGYGMGGYMTFWWTNWVTTVLLWALILVAIIAIVKHISHN